MASTPAAKNVNDVNYETGGNSAASIPSAAPGGVTTLLTGGDPDPHAEFLRDLVSSPESTFHIESAITRGQTPLRSVFLSDRVIIAAIIAAAVFIPIAVHDARQANPPIN